VRELTDDDIDEILQIMDDSRVRGRAKHERATFAALGREGRVKLKEDINGTWRRGAPPGRAGKTKRPV
jgi:hypothetical protein